MIDQRGIDIIKSFEGLYLKRYICPAGVPTIGYGSTHWWDGGPIPLGAVLEDEDEAVRLMSNELLPTESFIRRIATKGSEAQIAALVSFAYNIGITALKGSTLLRKHNRGDYEGASQEFTKWNKAGGRVLAGLVRRRAAEKELYLEGVA